MGLGLMGGSLAMRLKQDQTCQRVVALLRREEAVHQAQALGVVDWATTDPEAALRDADLIIFATPVKVLIGQIHTYQTWFKPNAIVTDLGSTKREITQALGQLLPAVNPIGSHPMCGKEISGLVAAEASLYEGATWVISPLPKTPSTVVSAIDGLARAVGASPLLLDPERHDTLVAAISHLPYTLSAALVLAVQQVAQVDEHVWQVAASGFKDTSRLAASDVQMMMDILLTNQAAVAAMISQFRRHLDQIDRLIADGDEEALHQLLCQARDQRRSLYQ